MKELRIIDMQGDKVSILIEKPETSIVVGVCWECLEVYYVEDLNKDKCVRNNRIVLFEIEPIERDKMFAYTGTMSAKDLFKSGSVVQKFS